jgi:hypothetical protein
MAVLKRPVLGCGVIVGNKGNFLVISDLHIPYHHPKAFDFLYKVYRAYKCQYVLNVGDIVDNHSGSYHESEPDAYGPEEEYELAKRYMQDLQDMFPVMTITPGNHCLIPQRKAKTVGLPSSMLSDFNRIYDLDDGWEWVDVFKFDSGKGVPHLIPMRLNKRGWDGDVRAL